jgi:hypothetical protein
LVGFIRNTHLPFAVEGKCPLLKPGAERDAARLEFDHRFFIRVKMWRCSSSFVR